MTYYYYHNPDTNPHLTIHEGDCGHCKNGKGKDKIKTRGVYGVWSGPFDTVELAENYIDTCIKLGKIKTIEYCSICNPIK